MQWVRAVLFFILASAFCANAQAQSAGRRVALVIGNSAYTQQGALSNPGPDSQLIAEALRRVGYAVVQRTDLDKQGMQTALHDFAAQADGAEVALIYFAGHGMEAGGANWLLPVDVRLGGEADIRAESISLDQMIAAVGRARVLRMVVLDACRENPFAAAPSGSGLANTVVRNGLAEVEVSGALVLYAARGGTLAYDGPRGGNSPFATAFARRLMEPAIDVRIMIGSVRDDVLAATSRESEPQEPFYYGSLPGVSMSLGLAPGEADDTRAARSALAAIPIEEWTNLGDGFFDELLRLAPLTEYVALAELGDAQAQFVAGSAYFLGRGGAEKSGILAARYWRLAAAQGLPAAQNNLATMIARGDGGLEKNERRSAELYKLAADQGHVAAQMTYGVLLEQGIGGVERDEAGAVYYYQLSAAAGNAIAQTNLADMYIGGRGGLRRDEAAAARLLKQAADQGYLRAINNLGVMTEDGRGGIRRDRNEAIRLYRQASRQGYAGAQQNLDRLTRQ